MLAKTAGIIIRNTRYGEGSLISKIYTRQFGMQSYMINGVQAPKAAIKASMLQPVMLLDMVVYHNSLKDIQRIKEAKNLPVLRSIHFDIVKSGVGLFVSEILNKAIKEEEPNERLYDFAAEFILRLDAETGSLALWPLFFMVKLTNILGFSPTNNFDPMENKLFDLVEGGFTEYPQKSEFAISMPDSQYFSKLLEMEYADLPTAQIPKPIRSELLNKLILYYKLHLPDFQDIKSVEVLAGL
jgi:DNA repair protein RecO (recombination protein O)